VKTAIVDRGRRPHAADVSPALHGAPHRPGIRAELLGLPLIGLAGRLPLGVEIIDRSLESVGQMDRVMARDGAHRKADALGIREIPP
jgi:hypothetical protein